VREIATDSSKAAGKDSESVDVVAPESREVTDCATLATPNRLEKAPSRPGQSSSWGSTVPRARIVERLT
jgi:hypothetical protein